MIEWFAVYTRPQAEVAASDRLRRQGYHAYLPMQRVWISHARRRRVASRPLFPRYLFVALDRSTTGWHPILSTVGVADMVRIGDKPAVVNPTVIDTIRKREGEGAFDRITAVQKFKLGEVVRIVAGPFEDCIGRLVEASDDERVHILFNILGRPVRARLSADALVGA